MKIVKYISLFMLSALLVSCSAKRSEETYPEITAIGKNTTRTDILFEEKTEEYLLEKDAVYGIRFTSDGNFIGVDISGSTKKTKDARVSVCFYRWLDSYEKTMEQSALEKSSFHLTDTKLSSQFIFSGDGFSAGEYLITFSTSAKDVYLDFGKGIKGSESFKNGTVTADTVCVGLIKRK